MSGVGSKESLIAASSAYRVKYRKPMKLKHSITKDGKQGCPAVFHLVLSVELLLTSSIRLLNIVFGPEAKNSCRGHKVLLPAWGRSQGPKVLIAKK